MAVSLGGLAGRRIFRYGVVSALTVVAGQVVLFVLLIAADWTARTSNMVAFLVASALSYTLNRRWTWGRRGRSHLMAEVAPFWAITVAGLALTTWAAGAAEGRARDVTGNELVQALIIGGAVIGSFVALWLAKFIVFDKLYVVWDRPSAGRSAMFDGDPSSDG